jgi:hypothetical protein
MRNGIDEAGGDSEINKRISMNKPVPTNKVTNWSRMLWRLLKSQ